MVECDKSCQRADWGRRPLTEAQKAYDMDDALWLRYIFDRINDNAKEEHFVESIALHDKHSGPIREYNPKDWGMGDKPVDHRKVMEFLWRKF